MPSRSGGGARSTSLAWKHPRPSDHHRASDGPSSTRPSSWPFSVPHTSGRPCLLSFTSPPYSQPIFSYKDFSECFPLWCEEQPNGAEGVFNTVSTFIETHIVVRFPLPSPAHILPTNVDIYHVPHFGGGNTRTTQINCSSNMTSRKTWISCTK